jgi:Family of unknown function (DUF5313)
VGRLPGDPHVAGKLLFAIGFRLPERNREWVRHDLTDAGWRGRLLLRHMAVVLPICLVFALLPGAVWIRVAVPALFAICSIGIVAMYAGEIRAARLRRHDLAAPDNRDQGRPSPLRTRGLRVQRVSGVNSMSFLATSVRLPDREG